MSALLETQTTNLKHKTPTLTPPHIHTRRSTHPHSTHAPPPPFPPTHTCRKFIQQFANKAKRTPIIIISYKGKLTNTRNKDERDRHNVTFIVAKTTEIEATRRADG